MRLRINMRIGVAYGLLLALASTAFALFASLVQGSTYIRTHDGASVAVELLVAAYWVGGLSCGIVVGLLLPLARYRVGAVMGGALAALPVYAAAHLSQFGFVVPKAEDVAAVAFASAVVGGAAGYALRDYYKEEIREMQRRESD